MKCPYCGGKLSYEAEPFGLQKVAVVSCQELNCPNGYIAHVAYSYSLERAVRKAEKKLLKCHKLFKALESMDDPSTGD